MLLHYRFPHETTLEMPQKKQFFFIYTVLTLQEEFSLKSRILDYFFPKAQT